MMPEVMGHELPTPGNADSPKQKKHREQAIVIGTLLLVILTFILVKRHGTNADPNAGTDVMSDPNAYQGMPGTTGGGGAIGDPTSAELAALPGQVAALNQSGFNRLQRSSRRQGQRLNELQKQLRALSKKETQQAAQLRRMRAQHPSAHGHPKHPTVPIHVTAHAKAPHTQEHWTSKQAAPRHHAAPQMQWGHYAYPVHH